MLQGPSETALTMLAKGESQEQVEQHVREQLARDGYPDVLMDTSVPILMRKAQELLQGPNGDKMRAEAQLV